VADTKISALTDGVTANATDRIPVARDPGGTPLSRYITPAYVKDYILGLANTWTAAQTIAQGTITADAPHLNGTVTWNHSGVTFTAWKLNVTSTASASASKLADLQIGAATMFDVRKDGLIRAAKTSGGGAITYGTTAQADTGLGLRTNRIDFAIGGAGVFGLSTTFAGAGSDKALGFWNSSAAHDGSAMSVGFYRNADGIMSVRASSTTTPAAFNFYTYAASPPSAPSASMALLYSDTSGGKIRLMALFPSGAAQQIAIEP